MKEKLRTEKVTAHFIKETKRAKMKQKAKSLKICRKPQKYLYLQNFTNFTNLQILSLYVHLVNNEC